MSGKSGFGERVMNQARTMDSVPLLPACPSPSPSLLPHKPLPPPPNAARPGRPPHEELQINYKAVDRAVEEDARLTIGARQAAHQVRTGDGEARQTGEDGIGYYNSPLNYVHRKMPFTGRCRGADRVPDQPQGPAQAHPTLVHINVRRRAWRR